MIAKLQEEETKEAAKREAIQFKFQTTMSNLEHFFYMGKKRIIKCVHRDKIQAELNPLKQKAAADRGELLRGESDGRDELLRGESDDWRAMQAELSALCDRQERLDAMNAVMRDDVREAVLTKEEAERKAVVEEAITTMEAMKKAYYIEREIKHEEQYRQDLQMGEESEIRTLMTIEQMELSLCFDKFHERMLPFLELERDESDFRFRVIEEEEEEALVDMQERINQLFCDDSVVREAMCCQTQRVTEEEMKEFVAAKTEERAIEQTTVPVVDTVNGCVAAAQSRPPLRTCVKMKESDKVKTTTNIAKKRRHIVREEGEEMVDIKSLPH